MGKLKNALDRQMKNLAKKKSKNVLNKPAISKTTSIKPSLIKVPIHHWNDSTSSSIPIRSDSKVLVIGDGDFSYSKSLVYLLGRSVQLYATSYDDEESLFDKYQEARENVDFLRKQPNCKVLFNVDCFHLDKVKEIKKARFDRIIFNFPHVGKGIKDKFKNVLANQKLIEAFFTNSGNFLLEISSKMLRYSTNCIKQEQISKDSSFVHDDLKNIDNPNNVTLQYIDEYDSSEGYNNSEWYSSQKTGIEAEIHITLKTGDPYDLWDIKGIAHKCGFKCKESFVFFFEKYPYYYHKRTIGDIKRYIELEDAQDDILDGKQCKTFVFIKQ